MAYKSQIDLGGLGEVPKTTDSQTFSDFTDVYNAIHILAQWTNALAERLQDEGDKGSDKQPWELLTFERWIWLPARQNIKQGDVVSSINHVVGGTTWNGVYKGCYGLVHTWQIGSWGIETWLGKVNYLCGVALEDAAVGELVKFGIGPAIINMTGVKAGDRLYSKPTFYDSNVGTQSPVASNVTFFNDGKIYLNPPANINPWPQSANDGFTTVIPQGTSKTGPVIPGGTFPYDRHTLYMPIGYGVSDNAAMFLGPNMLTDFTAPVRSS